MKINRFNTFIFDFSWDSFPLFQILNDYLRTDGKKIADDYNNSKWSFFFQSFNSSCFSDNLKNGKFHQHLRDIFAPQVVRYVDLMESSISQSIYKGFEKEKWEIKG